MTGARTITTALGGRWYGHYGLACCPAHGNTRTPALSIADGRDGRLLARCHAGCAFNEILDALRARGIVEGVSSFSSVLSVQRRAESEARERALTEKRAAQAHQCWREARPIGGTLAERYLRGRGITCELPEALRFRPSCWHASAKRLPAMIARVDGAAGFAIHRTYLQPDGAGKADADPPKAMLGAVQGGAVRLSDGAEKIVVAEGIETALALACGLLRGPAAIWAALSTSGMAGLRLPDRPRKLIVATDGDEAGRAAGHKLAERAHDLGWEVSLLPAPNGRDWNDVLIGKAVPA